MRNLWTVWAACILGTAVCFSGCGGRDEGKASSTAESLEAGNAAPTEVKITAAEDLIPKAEETFPETVETVLKSKSYYMITEENGFPAPCLVLFDDDTFGFSYDVLSSYYPNGTYKIENDRLKAVTDDGEHTYVFQIDGERYIFLQDESSDVTLIDRGIGAPVTDKAVFALREPEAEMVAVVKEIQEDCLLVSSRSDEHPGAYYVYIGENDISQVKPGAEIRILWDGAVLETSPAQIYAGTIESME